jgi:hypothetical protein
MPNDAKLAPGVRCVENADHEQGHVIYTQGHTDGFREIFVWYYRVNLEQRTLKAAMHADFRGPDPLTDEELHAFWAYFEYASAQLKKERL